MSNALKERCEGRIEFLFANENDLSVYYIVQDAVSKTKLGVILYDESEDEYMFAASERIALGTGSMVEISKFMIDNIIEDEEELATWEQETALNNESSIPQ